MPTDQEKRKRALEAIRKNPGASTNSILKEADVSYNTLESVRIEAGLAPQERTDKNGRPCRARLPKNMDYRARERHVTEDSILEVECAARLLGSRKPGNVVLPISMLKAVLSHMHAAGKSKVPFEELWETLMERWKRK